MPLIPQEVLSKIFDLLSVFDLNLVASSTPALHWSVVEYWGGIRSHKICKNLTFSEFRMTLACMMAFDGKPVSMATHFGDLKKVIRGDRVLGKLKKDSLAEALSRAAAQEFITALNRTVGKRSRQVPTIVLKLVKHFKPSAAVVISLICYSYAENFLMQEDVAVLLRALHIHEGKAFCYNALDNMFRLKLGGFARKRKRRRSELPEKLFCPSQILAGVLLGWQPQEAIEYLHHLAQSNSAGAPSPEHLVADLADWLPFYKLSSISKALPDASVALSLRLLIRRQRLGPIASATYIASFVSSWPQTRRNRLVQQITRDWDQERRERTFASLQKLVMKSEAEL